MGKSAWDWGIDLGGTKCECVVLEGDEVLLRHRIPTERRGGYDLESRAEAILSAGIFFDHRRVGGALDLSPLAEVVARARAWARQETGAAAALDALIAATRARHEQLSAAIEQGRDRLLELAAQRAAPQQQLLQALRGGGWVPPRISGLSRN